mmetsp:Transcript_10071/g.22502  ORF Transcript_10071/g.22502 Transcript_10071/m.22502 type:complete len:154 (-) Transcript_10071:524-985(-)
MAQPTRPRGQAEEQGVRASSAAAAVRQSNISHASVAGQTTMFSKSRTAVPRNRARARKRGDTDGQLRRYLSDFECTVIKHRDITLRLMRESAVRGESSVPSEKMARVRSGNIALLRVDNLIAHGAGGVKLSEAELVNRIAKAERDAVRLYAKE